MSIYENSALIRYGNFIFHHRNKVFPAALVALLVVFPPSRPTHDVVWHFVVYAAVLAVAMFGQALRVLTVGLEYIKRGGLNKRIYANQLVTNGVFAHCRNPLYLGNILIAFGLLSLSGRVAVVAVGGAATVATYIATVAAEEKYLRNRFGAAYEDYCSTTNRWIPRFRGLSYTIGSMHFNWRRVLLKECNSFYAWLICAVVIIGAVDLTAPFHRLDFVLTLSLFMAATVGFIAIRTAKRLRWLRLQ